MSDGKNLPSLTGTNFNAWKIKVQGYCMQHGLYKFLTSSIPPADPVKREDWDDKRIKVTGILYQCIGETNHQRFITKDNTEDPHKIWTELLGYYESSSVQNQSIVYQEFLALTFKSNLATFLDDLDARLSSMAAVGLVIGNPEKADLKESLLAEAILAKLPSEFNPSKEILYQKRPLTIKMICETLDCKRREMASSLLSTPTVKVESALKAKGAQQKPMAQCSPGWHNPATKHSAEGCFMAKKPKPKAKSAITPKQELQSDNDSLDTTGSGLRISIKNHINRARRWQYSGIHWRRISLDGYFKEDVTLFARARQPSI
ncbi:uncharacterized protein VP01_531g14 [Puccinia sorghi]|uniref:DUF4219 domain-containing protein n=1 Tax=Puccinia sorghi TaxID=27349 RepID=A0A0L6UK95_9BASI|nr:uncharacterized protein VP01_531g14 [Puccinia sorghi]